MPDLKWLITGGAGYIGSHIADAFLASGREIVIYDSLYQGLASRIEFLRSKYEKEVPLVVGDICDRVKFENSLLRYQPHGIIHAAALKSVSESMEQPNKYFEVNFHATATMLELVKKHGIKNFFFSSSAAVYGSPNHLKLVKENDEKNPISPYGLSKLAAESRVNSFLTSPVNRGTSLRYFNAIGCAAPELRDNSRENLIPIVINKLKAGESPVIYGTDYPTSDGTGVRDYVDVRDIAAAHLVASEAGQTIPAIFNLGTGRGVSVREMVKMLLNAMKKSDIQMIDAPRRAGDAAFLCADMSLAVTKLGFTPKYSLEESIRSLF